MANYDLEFLEKVLEHLQESVFLINSAGIVLIAANETQHGLVGDHITEHVSKAHGNRLCRSISEAFRSKRAVTCEVKGRLGKPREAWFSFRISPVLRDDEAVSAMLFASDITERRSRDLARKKRDRNRYRNERNRRRAVENILTMCAKTKKVRFRGEWLSIEDFLWKRYGFRISHGLSPEAYNDALEITDEADLSNEKA